MNHDPRVWDPDVVADVAVCGVTAALVEAARIELRAEFDVADAASDAFAR